MSQTIEFQILSCSSWDDGHAPKELLFQSHSSKGWISEKFCLFPQEIVIELACLTRVRKLQFLSHENKIASKIELWTGLPNSHSSHPISTESYKWSRLGHFSFSSNHLTQYKQRELKSIHIDVTCRYLRLLCHQNHQNPVNLYGQVGLVAVNVLGSPLNEFDPSASRSAPASAQRRPLPPISNAPISSNRKLNYDDATRHHERSLQIIESAESQPRRRSSSHIVGRTVLSSKMNNYLEDVTLSSNPGLIHTHAQHSHHLNPALLGRINPARDIDPSYELETTMTLDRNSAVRLRELSKLKKDAVATEDYLLAAQAQKAIAYLKESGKLLAQLEQEKQDCVQAERFEDAHHFKQELMKARKEIDDTITRLLDAANQNQKRLDQTPALPQISNSGTTELINEAESVSNPSVTKLSPQNSHQPQDQPSVTSENEQPRSNSPPLPTLQKQPRSNSPPLPTLQKQEDESLNDEIPDRFKDEIEPPKPKQSATPIPPTKSKGRGRARAARGRGGRGRGRGGGHGRMAGKTNVMGQGSLENAPSRAPDTDADPDELPDHKKTELNTCISVFGEEVIQSLLSKAWQLRAKALDSISDTLESWTGNESNLNQACADVFSLLLSEKNKQMLTRYHFVFHLFIALAEKQNRQLTDNNIDRCIESVLPSLLKRLGDTNSRSRDGASQILQSISLVVGGKSSTFTSILLRVKGKEPWKELQGRLSNVLQIVQTHGINKLTGCDVSSVMNLSSKCIKHTRKEVRHAAIQLAIFCMKTEGESCFDMLGLDSATDDGIVKALYAAYEAGK